MGVNMAGNCIISDEACRNASKQEIIRRYYSAACALRQGLGTVEEVRKIELIMNSIGLSLPPQTRVRRKQALRLSALSCLTER